MKITRVGKIHQNKEGKWVIPYFRRTQSGGEMPARFEYIYYSKAKQRRNQIKRMIEENDGLYIPKKKVANL